MGLGGWGVGDWEEMRGLGFLCNVIHDCKNGA